MLLLLLCGIVPFQFESLKKWQKDLSLSTAIQHVGGGAGNSYTDFKQKMLSGYKPEKRGDTAITGAAELALDNHGV